MVSLSLRVYQKINPNAEFSVLLENKKSKDSLLFQAGTVSSLGQAETDDIRGEHYGRLMDVYGCLGVLQVCPSEHTQLYLVVVTRCVKVCNIENSAIAKIQEVDIVSLQSMRSQNQKPQDEEPWIRELKKLLSNESFYFSAPLSTGEAFDITLCAQRRAKGAVSDNRFFWNRMLHLHPKRFGVNTDKWLIKMMCGSIEFSTLYMNNHRPKLFIISRLSCERAGTRFNVRGVNDAGHVANFVETEQLILVDSLDNMVLSYIQIRGTVPLFWEQPGLNVGSHKVKMSREPEVSVQAFRKHARYLREKYGKQVVLNLLGTGVTGKRQGEAALSHLFQHLNCQWSKDAPHIVFDFHQECRGSANESLVKKLQPQISQQIYEFGFFCSINGRIEKLQSGVMRTNCLDCLDRTNRVQSFLALDVMHRKLEVMGVANNGVIVQRFTSKLEEMWRDNGNRISQNYAGTGALQGSKIIDGARSAGRMIQNNLLDNSKQEAIDILLHGNLLNNYLATLSRSLLPSSYLYAPLKVLSETCERVSEFCKPVTYRVAVGTFNVNGGKHFRSLAYKHLSLDDWLLDSQKNEGMYQLIDMSPSNEDVDKKAADIFAIGFEEIVDLTAQNIVQNTQWSENANSWGRELQKVISRDERYVMVTWKQLVGVALFVFVHEKHAGLVRDVSVETVKTGMQGATGNKGGVGIRMVLRNTSMAFVCSHFAAGQKEVNERNSDYDSIARKMIFNLGVPLWAHDYVFWCGDFNYRINLPRDEVIDLIQRQEWSLLLNHDQLNISQKDGKCFKGFLEGDITFQPTYKYDLFSDDYDTSEKCRVPAWTDRVLFWARQYPKDKNNPHWKPGKIVHYGRAELKQSDHRPVLSIIDVEGRILDENKRTEIYQSVVESLGPTDCTIVATMMNPQDHEVISSFMTEDRVANLKDQMEKIGTVVLIRSLNDTLLVTFKDSKMALDAVSLRTLKLDETDFLITLKMEDWRQRLQEELSLCGDTTVPLLEENLEFSEQLDISFDNVEDVMEQLYLDDDDADGLDHSDAVTPTPPEPVKPARPAPPRPALPSRPPPPRPTPHGSGSDSPIPTLQEKLSTTERPARPAQLFSPDDLLFTCSGTAPSLEYPRPPSTLSTPTPPPPALPSRTPSFDSSVSSGSTRPPLLSSQSLPSPPAESAAFVPPVSAAAPSPHRPPPLAPPSGILHSHAFPNDSPSAPPTEFCTVPQSGPPSSLLSRPLPSAPSSVPPPSAPPPGPAPSAPSSTPAPSSHSSPPSGPAPSAPPSAPAPSAVLSYPPPLVPPPSAPLAPSSGLSTGPPPMLPPRSPSHSQKVKPAVASTIAPLVIPSRTLPPLPARTLPPLPPRK